MKVYVVLFYTGESDEVVGVYSQKEDAEVKEAEIESRPKERYQHAYVEAHEVVEEEYEKGTK